MITSNYTNADEKYLNNFLEKGESYDVFYDTNIRSNVFNFKIEYNNRIYFFKIYMFGLNIIYITNSIIIGIRRNMAKFNNILNMENLKEFYCYHNKFDNFATKAVMLSMDNKKVKELFLDGLDEDDYIVTIIDSYNEYIREKYYYSGLKYQKGK